MKTALIPNNMAQSRKISILPPQGNWDFLGKGRMRAGLRFLNFQRGGMMGPAREVWMFSGTTHFALEIQITLHPDTVDRPDGHTFLCKF